MTIVERLIEIVSALDELQIPHLVMGGHAVRYYGFNRETTLRETLARVTPCSTRHQLLIEAVRLRYKRAMQAIDRQEKINRRKQS